MARKRYRAKATAFKPLTYGIRPAPSIPTHVTVALGIDSSAWTNSFMWVPVISSNVSAALYNKKVSELYLTFSHGATYRYSHVPQSVAEMFFNVNSPGGFEHRVLRPNYPAVDVTGLAITP